MAKKPATPVEEVTEGFGTATPVEDTDAAEPTVEEAEGTEAPAKPVIPDNFCLCGCGTKIGRRSKFAQGHDMKVKAKVLANLKAGEKNLFAGIPEAAVEYCKLKYANYIATAIDKAIEKPAKKDLANLSHYNKLAYMAQLN